MDNSEEDAGAATIASRRVSAREKELGAPEEAPPSDSAVRDAHSVGSMGEEASDLDSMPSPGTHDPNTSTEAILDMIDEFVDGPTASRRMSYLSDPLPELKLEAAPKAPDPEVVKPAHPSSDVKFINVTDTLFCTNAESVSSQSASVNSVEPSTVPTLSESIVKIEIQLPPIPSHSEIVESVKELVTPTVDCSVESLQASSSQSEGNIIESRPMETVELATGESSNIVQPDLPSSSANQNIANVDHSDSIERTVNSASTSEVTDRLTVDSVESTSSDSSVSVRINNKSLIEGSTHSPLKRRLVRPTPSDRPPDCTVSSTVDSQSDVNICGQSDCITKDVSSSSDAVPVVHDYVKPEEIRNISEVSFCQAETSVSPKKIKLVRPKPTNVTKPVLDSNNRNILPSEAERCQPSSSGNDPTNIPETSKENSMSLLKLLIQNVPDQQSSLASDQDPTNVLESTQECDNTAPSLQNFEPESSQINEPISKSHESKCNPEPRALLSNKDQLVPKTELIISQGNQNKEIMPENSLPAKKLTPLKINVPRSNSPCSSTVEAEIEVQKRVPPLKLNVSNREQSPKKQVEDISKPESEKKVPPLKISKVCDSESSTNLEKKVPSLKLSSQKNETVKTEEPSCSEEKKVPPLRIITANCESTSMQSDDSTEKKIPPLKITMPNEDKKIPPIKINTHTSEVTTILVENTKCQVDKFDEIEKKVPPIKLILTGNNSCESSNVEQSEDDSDACQSESDSKVPKLTIKLGTKQSQQEEMKFPVPKLTIKPLKPPCAEDEDSKNKNQISTISKLNIKPISKPAEKINDVHRKSSSSEISESEYSENEESASTSDQASASDHGLNEEVPKVTIKLGKPEKKDGTATESNKFTIRSVQNCNIVPDNSQIKLLITESNVTEKVPKLTIKGISKTGDQPLSPKLTIKLPDHDFSAKDCEKTENQPIPKLRISASDKSIPSIKENTHVPKITIKPLTRSGPNSPVKVSKKSIECENEHFPAVTKINIKPVIRPQDAEINEVLEVPVVSKLNIKPVVKPSKDQESVFESNTEDVNKLPKLDVKHLKIPEDVGHKTFEESCTVIPNVTKINIKPIVKPESDENQSSETGNSSDDNTDVPVVTKLNIKPICNPAEQDEKINDNIVPIVTKLNIKPVVDPNESGSLSPKLDGRKITKLNIKPVVKPDEEIEKRLTEEAPVRNPPLLMKINKRIVADSEINHADSSKEHVFNNIVAEDKHNTVSYMIAEKSHVNCNSLAPSSVPIKLNEEPSKHLKEEKALPVSACNVDKHVGVKTRNMEQLVNTNTNVILNPFSNLDSTRSSVQNCTLLKKLLENKSDFRMDHKFEVLTNKIQETTVAERNCVDRTESPTILSDEHINLTNDVDKEMLQTKTTEPCPIRSKLHSFRDKDVLESITKPLEINISERVASPSSGQDSPRIILKINKTDQGSSAQIITEETRRPETPKSQEEYPDKDHDSPTLKKVVNSRRKQNLLLSPTVDLGKRLRSSKIVNTETPPAKRQYAGKRQPATEVSPPQPKQPELSILEAKRLRLGQILSNKNLTVTKVSPPSPPNKPCIDLKQQPMTVNHTKMNNENCSKNGNSKLHSILSNLAAKQIQALPLNDLHCTEKNQLTTQDLDVNISAGSAIIEVVPVDDLHIVNENSDSRDCVIVSEEVSRDPLEDENKQTAEKESNTKSVEITPTPRKRGRPRKLPVTEETKPVTLPVTALEERPQRSLRLSREKPAIIAKPRGRGRGRGAKRNTTPPNEEATIERANSFFAEQKIEDSSEKRPDIRLEEIDPTSSRLKLPRMTEALDKSVCNTPLSSRRRSSDMIERSPDMTSLFDSMPKMDEMLMRSPSNMAEKGRGGRGSRGGRGRGRGTPRGTRGPRGRTRGGGKGAQYMRETMGIYGRVCGPATTTVELFEEEAQMMEDSATPTKPSHLMDEDSQSSVKSSTNDSSKLKKSKFAELFDSNKVWAASDIKEYTWPPPEQSDVEHQVMMIQEQVALFLGVKSFKRRYPELRRRPILGEEKDYVLTKEVASEALCELGITAVDASEVLDIMLSDYPHKYEEYRQHQREKQLAEAANEQEVKAERVDRVEMKISEKPAETKLEPKVDPEKTRQDMARAAIASASEFNALVNAFRRPAAVDLQSLTIHRRRPPPPAPVLRLRPPAGYYPHALLPGQYQHHYRTYTADQLRYFPLNTVVSAPPASPADSGSDSEHDDSSSDSDVPDPTPSKRRKVTKTKRSSQSDTPTKRDDDPKENVDLCRVCNLRVEANRKYTHERFLVCSSCNANLHPGCLELSADTIRKCREYAWQCADCKCCASCRARHHDDKMLFCDLCDRGFHIYCVGLDAVPSGRWHCVECAVCKSCGAREPGGPPPREAEAAASSGLPPGLPAGLPAEWHHHTKRGPGGHKVYSHSLCTPCARAYRIGRYCPLCDRSFIGPKGNLQLIICKLCDRQHHQDCVRQTLSKVKVLDYTCAECRRAGITSRSAAVRLAPRTIATLFMAKRRFNKYAHRQYLQSRGKLPASPDASLDAEASDPEAADPEVNDPLDNSLNDYAD